MSNKLIIGDFYRVWTHNLDKSEKSQTERIMCFVNQIIGASKLSKQIIITGDANLCTSKWRNSSFLHKNVSGPLISCLDEIGLEIAEIGPTFQADHILPNGIQAESNIDHVYYSSDLRQKITIEKLSNSSTDHLPVIASVKVKNSERIYERKITKRNMKNFSETKWCEALATKIVFWKTLKSALWMI